MDRRGFLRALLAAAPASFALDLEKLLWVKKKTIFIPPADTWIRTSLFEQIYGPPLIDEFFINTPILSRLRECQERINREFSISAELMKGGVIV